MVIEPHTWYSLEVAIYVLHAISFVAALAVFYVRMRQHQRLVAHYSIPLAIYHLSQLIHFSLYTVIMTGAPAAACFARRFAALYTTRSMQFFGAGFALRIWIAVSRHETGLLLTSDNWRRLDRWTAWISFSVPFLPALLGVVPQMFMVDQLRTTSMFDCKYAYSARWQLLASDSVWALPPTVMCMVLICASIVKAMSRWGGMRHYVGHRTMPASMMIRLAGVAANIGVIGVFHMYFNCYEYFTGTGSPMSPAGPAMIGWTQSQQNNERLGHVLGDLSTSIIGILDFLAFGTDYSSLRLLGGRRCTRAANTFREKFSPAPTPTATINVVVATTAEAEKLAEQQQQQQQPPHSPGHRTGSVNAVRPATPTLPRPALLPVGKQQDALPHRPAPLTIPLPTEPLLLPLDADDGNNNSLYYECPSFEYQRQLSLHAAPFGLVPPARAMHPILRHSSLPTMQALHPSGDPGPGSDTDNDTDDNATAPPPPAAFDNNHHHPSEAVSSVVVVPRRQAFRTPQPSPPPHSTRGQRKVSLAAVGGLP